MIPLVVASERGGWLNRAHVIPGRGCVCGVVGTARLSSIRLGASSVWLIEVAGWSAVDGESPVGENCASGGVVSRVAAGP